MTAISWSSGNLHNTDANFRIWGSELNAKFAAAGLVQTADTGQVNWATATRPAINTDTYYEIWRWNDTQQASAPIFMKVYYGTGTSATYPRWRIELGTATDGAGVISGIGSGVIVPMNVSGLGAGSATPFPSYLCVTDGFFGISWKRGQSAQGFIIMCRTCTAAGVPDADGLLVWGYGSTSTNSSYVGNLRLLRYASPASNIYSAVASNAAFELGVIPGWLASSITPGGDKQIYLCWGSFPEVRPIFGIGAYQVAEFAEGSTFTTAMVGTTTRTFMAMGHRSTGLLAGSATHSLAMLWE